MAKGLRRKDLKRPDEFVTRTNQVLEFINANRRTTIAAASIAILVAAAALSVRAYREWQRYEAREAFGVAYHTLETGDPEGGVNALRAVHADWAGTPAAELALVYAANGLAELDKIDEATAAYRELLEVSRQPPLRQIALYNLGVLSAEGGEAAEQLRRAAEIDGPLRGAAWVAARQMGSGPVDDGEIPAGISADAREYFSGRPTTNP